MSNGRCIIFNSNLQGEVYHAVILSQSDIVILKPHF